MRWPLSRAPWPRWMRGRGLRVAALALLAAVLLAAPLVALRPWRATQDPRLLPGQQRWDTGVSSYLFGTNDTEAWAPDNVQTDPHGVIQPALKDAHLTLMRTFFFHYSLRDGHRTSIGTTPRLRLDPANPDEYAQPGPPPDLYTGPGYEVERRIATVEQSGMRCLGVLPAIWTTPAENADPNPLHQRIIDPATGQLETDLDFARKVVAYLGDRCNLYEIGNEPDLDEYAADGSVVAHMDVQTYVARWTAFVRELRKINPHARFIGPVTYNATGNDCVYRPPFPFPASQPGDCYLRNFLHGVTGTDVEPDAVSFHWYPCWEDSAASCLAKAATYKTVALEVKGWAQEILGRPIPVGISEWNMDPGSNRVLGDDATFMDQFTRAALGAMIEADLDFANQFDAQSYSGYGALDMFDIAQADQPKAQFLALREVIARYRRPRHPRPSRPARRRRPRHRRGSGAGQRARAWRSPCTRWATRSGWPSAVRGSSSGHGRCGPAARVADRSPPPSACTARYRLGVATARTSRRLM